LHAHELFQVPRLDNLDERSMATHVVDARVTHGIFAERVTLSESFVNLDVDDRRVMTLEKGDVLLCDIRIPDACQIIGAARDKNVQVFAEIETFAALKQVDATRRERVCRRSRLSTL
jgi:hypothetical protein